MRNITENKLVQTEKLNSADTAQNYWRKIARVLIDLLQGI